MSSEHKTGTRIAELTRRLAALDRERAEIIVDLAELQRQQERDEICQEQPRQEPAPAAVTMNSSAVQKIALFRSLFRGREDVFPRRWDNPRTGNSGYAPACNNDAANLIARRRRNTLILVHRQQLLDQWRARLRTFLDIEPARIGVIGGGKRNATGDIDIALIQSLSRRGEVLDLVGDYGHLVVDECHHLSAVSFEAIARTARARFVLGLSATVTRKDGHHPIIFMQCGPIRHGVDARKQAAIRPFLHKVVYRRTDFHAVHHDGTERVPIQDLYRALARDESRNAMIFDDVLTVLEAGRSPVVLTERKDHLALLAGRLARFAKNVIVLRGGMKTNERRQVIEAMATVPDGEERVLLATGRYLGEGFDDPRLDTLFLTMPISWRGTLAQYAGRLHRLHPTKRQVIIFDYVDEREPIFARMAANGKQAMPVLGMK